MNVSSLQRQLGTRGLERDDGTVVGALVLAEDSLSVFRTQIVIFNHPSLQFRRSDVLVCCPWALDMHVASMQVKHSCT